MPLHVSDIRCGHNVVAVQTSRSILVSDFFFLQRFSATIMQSLDDLKFNELSSNPTVICWARGRLYLGSARGWRTTHANCQRSNRVAGDE